MNREKRLYDPNKISTWELLFQPLLVPFPSPTDLTTLPHFAEKNGFKEGKHKQTWGAGGNMAEQGQVCLRWNPHFWQISMCLQYPPKELLQHKFQRAVKEFLYDSSLAFTQYSAHGTKLCCYVPFPLVPFCSISSTKHPWVSQAHIPPTWEAQNMPQQLQIMPWKLCYIRQHTKLLQYLQRR